MEKDEIPIPLDELGDWTAIQSDLFEELRKVVAKLDEVMRDAYEFKRN